MIRPSASLLSVSACRFVVMVSLAVSRNGTEVEKSPHFLSGATGEAFKFALSIHTFKNRPQKISDKKPAAPDECRSPKDDTA